MKLTTSPILLVGAALLLTACGNNDAGKPSAAGKEAVAATVNGVAIGENSVRLLARERGEDPDNAASRKAIIDQLVVQGIASEEAVRKGLDKTPDVSARIEIGRRSLLATAFAQDYLQSHPVGDDALKAEYDKIKALPQGLEFKVRHIMLATEADAKEVIAALKKNPKAFDALAREKSRDAGSKDKGGDLGWSQPPTQNPEIDDAVVRLKRGQFAENPVKTYFGWHVVWLEDSRYKAAPSWEQIKPALKRQAEQEMLQKLMDEMKAKATVEIARAPAPANAAKPMQSGKK